MKEEIEFLMQYYESTYLEYDALCEFIENNMDLDEIDKLREELELLESDSSIDAYNYETTKKILQNNIEILNTVQNFKQNALSICYIKELHHLVFKHYTI